METFERELLNRINKRNADIVKESNVRDKTKAALDIYEAELAVAVKELRSRHGYDGLTQTLAGAESSLSDLCYLQMRDKSILVVKMMNALFDAADTDWENLQTWFKNNFRIEMYYNDNVKSDRFGACFAHFTELISDESFWSSERREPQDNEYLVLENPTKYRWEPCIEVLLPMALLDDMNGFLDACRAELARQADAWAKKWMSRNEVYGTKVAALKAALADAAS